MNTPIAHDLSRSRKLSVLGGVILWLAVTTVLPAQTVAPEAHIEPCNPGFHSQVTDGSSSFYTLKETIFQSIFPSKDDPRQWTPLTIGNLGEGWCEPVIGPPDGTGGALRQGWIGVPDAFFNRQIVGIYNYTKARAGERDENVGTVLLESPLSRRYDFGIIIPFVDSLAANAVLPSTTNFGDVTLENRIMVQDTQDFVLSFNFNLQLPTGDAATGGNRTILEPFVAWWLDLGQGFSFRGGTGYNLPVDSKPDGVRGTYFLDVAVGQTITKHDAAPFGDFTYYLSADFRQDSGGGDHTFLSFTPGFRTHLGNNYFLLAGVEFPVNGPRAFDERLTIVVLKGF